MAVSGQGGFPQLLLPEKDDVVRSTRTNERPQSVAEGPGRYPTPGPQAWIHPCKRPPMLTPRRIRRIERGPTHEPGQWEKGDALRVSAIAGGPTNRRSIQSPTHIQT